MSYQECWGYDERHRRCGSCVTCRTPDEKQIHWRNQVWCYECAFKQLERQFREERR